MGVPGVCEASGVIEYCIVKVHLTQMKTHHLECDTRPLWSEQQLPE